MNPETAIENLLQELKLDASRGICVAFSGGVDSACLIQAVVGRGYSRIVAAHVCHNLRPPEELEREIELVKTVCCQLGVSLVVARLKPGSVESLAKKKGIGIEAAARVLRYRALARVARRKGCAILMTAHHRGDLLESYLSGMLGGSGIEGLRGISACRSLGKNLNLIRPFLRLEKRELEAYVAARKIVSSNDSTNASSLFRRNNIRANLVPVIDRVLPGWKTAAETTMGKLRSDASLIGEIAEKAWAATLIGRSGTGIVFSRNKFLDCHRAIQNRLLLKAFSLILKKPRISLRAIETARKSIGVGITRMEASGIQITCVEDTLKIEPSLDSQVESGYFFLISAEDLECSSSVQVHEKRYVAGNILLGLSWKAEGETGVEPGSIDKLCYDFPLVVRTRRPGDKITTSAGTIAIDDLLSSWKLSRVAKNAVPIVEDGNGIIAVLPGALCSSEGQIPGRHAYRLRVDGKGGYSLRLRIKGV